MRPDSYWTTYSLTHPLETHQDKIGRDQIVVYANQKGLPAKVMTRMKAAFDQSNSHDIHPIMASEVDKAERSKIPLACIILGKG